MSINKWEKWNFEIIPSDISESWSYSWLITVWPIVIPWAPEVFLVCGGNFRCWPKTDTSSAPSSRAGHYKDLTETENRARKVSGTQGTLKLSWVEETVDLSQVAELPGNGLRKHAKTEADVEQVTPNSALICSILNQKRKISLNIVITFGNKTFFITQCGNLKRVSEIICIRQVLCVCKSSCKLKLTWGNIICYQSLPKQPSSKI